MPDVGSAAYLEGYKALYAMDEGNYDENPYERGTQANTDWYEGLFAAVWAHW